MSACHTAPFQRGYCTQATRCKTTRCWRKQACNSSRHCVSVAGLEHVLAHAGEQALPRCVLMAAPRHGERSKVASRAPGVSTKGSLCSQSCSASRRQVQFVTSPASAQVSLPPHLLLCFSPVYSFTARLYLHTPVELHGILISSTML